MLLTQSKPRRRGLVLLAVLIIVVLLALAAYKYNDWMTSEARAAASSLHADQARAFAYSGVQYAAALLASDPELTLTGNPWDNPGLFQHIPVPSAARNARLGRFSVLSLNVDDSGAANGFRFGVTCESGKINLNAILLYDRYRGEVGKRLLMGLPNMTDDIADAILDWLDPDEEAREVGAENDYYLGLEPPYRCKNGPLDSLEELLLVKGVTPQLLFGNDRNRNGVIDPDEGDAGSDLGWQSYLTIYSREVNMGPDGLPRIHLNNPDLPSTIEKLKLVLPEELYMYIAAARLYGTSGGGRRGGGNRGGGGMGGGGGGGMGGSGGGGNSATPVTEADLPAVQAKIMEDITNSANKQLRNIRSLWDLVNTSVTITIGAGQQQKTVTYSSPMNTLDKQRELMPLLWQYCTASNDMDLTPRININTASPVVIAALKEAARLDDNDISAILANRPPPGAVGNDEIYLTPTWLLTNANLTVAKARRLDQYITTRSQVYRMQVLGYFDQGGPTARVEAIVDTNLGRPRIVFYRELSELGRGFDVGVPSQ